jgi:hypothetical protein
MAVSNPCRLADAEIADIKKLANIIICEQVPAQLMTYDIVKVLAYKPEAIYIYNIYVRF